MFPKQFKADEIEKNLMEFWRDHQIYEFHNAKNKPVYSIDTPPPTVSGKLHLGHVYSYTHPDIFARFWRMRGWQVFYPMGFDDNGIPTERLLERKLGSSVDQYGRAEFIEKCLDVSEDFEQEYEDLFRRLGLSIDWRYSYRTIGKRARRISQLSFLMLYLNNLAYQRKAPALWCPQCQTSLAQADSDELNRESELITIRFKLDDGNPLPIATTRPELLPACVAIFVNPGDERHNNLIGKNVFVPFFNHQVTIYADPHADPNKGTGAVMCCTFGDALDVNWWFTHNLQLVEAIDRQGRLTSVSGEFAGFTVENARKGIISKLSELGLITGMEHNPQSVRVHERCDTPIEYIITRQWFIRVLEYKTQLLELGEKVNWHPSHMKERYRSWVENLNWDWCISRQRYYGVPIPVWYCGKCGAIKLPEENQLPVDPTEKSPLTSCDKCGFNEFNPETDVLDTWATSSMTPQIVGEWLRDGTDIINNNLYNQVFPFKLRPQAHEIIRTWAFYTLLKSLYHFNDVPWSDILISGWGIAGEGMGKISKSRGGGPLPPIAMINRYSADAVRYWASSTGPGKDSVISEGKIQNGARLVTKLWNIARFSSRFLKLLSPDEMNEIRSEDIQKLLTPADQWILSLLQNLIIRTTSFLENYEYAIPKNEIESFLWVEFADNYLEMCKQRLYDLDSPTNKGAIFSLYHVLLNLMKLLAPYLPYVTDAIYQRLFKDIEGFTSIHLSTWPSYLDEFINPKAEEFGSLLVEIAIAVRRYKSQHNLPLSTELIKLQVATDKTEYEKFLQESKEDLHSITRAREVDVANEVNPNTIELFTKPHLTLNIVIAPA